MKAVWKGKRVETELINPILEMALRRCRHAHVHTHTNKDFLQKGFLNSPWICLPTSSTYWALLKALGPVPQAAEEAKMGGQALVCRGNKSCSHSLSQTYTRPGVEKELGIQRGPLRFPLHFQWEKREPRGGGSLGMSSLSSRRRKQIQSKRGNGSPSPTPHFLLSHSVISQDLLHWH